MDALATLVGRDRDLQHGCRTLDSGLNLLISGPLGIGKRTLMRALFETQQHERPCLWVAEGSAKQQAYQLALQVHATLGLQVPKALIPKRHLARAERDGVHWPWIERAIQRLSAQDCIALVVQSLRQSAAPPLICLETIDLPPSRLALFVPLLDACQVIACLSDESKLEQARGLHWRFADPARMRLEPLPSAASRELIERWLDQDPLAFASPAVREQFIQGVIRDSGGNPLAIRHMLTLASTTPLIGAANANDFAPEAGYRYLDMTPSVILLLGAAILVRFIARGAGSTELYVLAGFGLSLAIVLRFFLWPLMQRRGR